MSKEPFDQAAAAMPGSAQTAEGKGRTEKLSHKSEVRDVRVWSS